MKMKTDEQKDAKAAKPVLSDKEKIELLAGRVGFALKYLTCRGSGMIVVGANDPNATQVKMVHWMDDFCDALRDATGVEVDREKLREIRLPRSERQKLAAKRAKAAKAVAP